MGKDVFYAHFKELKMAMPRQILKTFIHKLLASDFKLTWRHDQHGVELEIQDGTEIIQLPMVVHSEKETVVEVNELKVMCEELALSLEELLIDCKGSGIVRTSSDGTNCVSYYDNGKMVSVLKTGKEEYSVSAGANELQCMKNNGSPESVKIFVINAEIDYYLMELHDAVQKQEYLTVLALKTTLSQLVKQKQALLHHQKKTGH